MGRAAVAPTASAAERLRVMMAEHRARQIALLELEGRIVAEEDRMGQPTRWDRLTSRARPAQMGA